MTWYIGIYIIYVLVFLGDRWKDWVGGHEEGIEGVDLGLGCGLRRVRVRVGI